MDRSNGNGDFDPSTQFVGVRADSENRSTSRDCFHLAWTSDGNNGL